MILDSKMLSKIIIACLIIQTIADIDSNVSSDATIERSPRNDPTNEMKQDCLTGYMTDVQNWVDRSGKLSHNIERRNAIDLTGKRDAVPKLMERLRVFSYREPSRELLYLSLSSCQLRRVPTIFDTRDREGRPVSSTLQHLTMYGNDFSDTSEPGDRYKELLNATDAESIDFGVRRPETSAWALGFTIEPHWALRQLDLRKCNIHYLTDRIFANMPKLEALYLGENPLGHISANTFDGLKSLLHLDMSRNGETLFERSLAFDNPFIFRNLTNLTSLDLSMVPLQQQDVRILRLLGPKMQRLSICYTGIRKLPNRVFYNTTLRFLDVSGNNGILDSDNPLGGLERHLEILYAQNTGLRSLHILNKFSRLNTLDLEGNELQFLDKNVLTSLSSLRFLNLDNNRITSWFKQTLKPLKHLKVLALRNNNLNIITKEMVQDFRNITFIGFTGNFIVCNCFTREIMELAYRNQNYSTHVQMMPDTMTTAHFDYHRAYSDFFNLVAQRKAVTRICTKSSCGVEYPLQTDGNFMLFDFDMTGYRCRMSSRPQLVQFFEVKTCVQTRKNDRIEDVIQDNRIRLIFLLIIPTVLFPVLIFCYVFRRSFKYFWITIRNSATLSLINKEHGVDDGTIFNYDVFVSYCNDDRNWVLDQLLPHVEKDCNVSVCLHERDFQVGLSILENIVSCMDRSKYIMLIISKQFLLSQWCQFEMHLAQHRLLETRREDLVLVLLEDIPRRLRPNTLHYLMLTKTYIVWPKHESEQMQFWRRLKRTLIAHHMKKQENVSLA